MAGDKSRCGVLCELWWESSPGVGSGVVAAAPEGCCSTRGLRTISHASWARCRGARGAHRGSAAYDLHASWARLGGAMGASSRLSSYDLDCLVGKVGGARGAPSRVSCIRCCVAVAASPAVVAALSLLVRFHCCCYCFCVAVAGKLLLLLLLLLLCCFCRAPSRLSVRVDCPELPGYYLPNVCLIVLRICCGF